VVHEWARVFLFDIITIMEGLGFFFIVVISTIGGGIYWHFFSRCSDEEEQ
jgi:hypothetical protein